MGFRPIRSCRVPYAKQGLIYFTCLTWRAQPPDVRAKIRRLCDQVGREPAIADALHEWLTGGGNVERIALSYHTSARTLYRRRLLFFERW